MLKVGIHENISISKETGLNDKGTLEIVLEEKSNEDLWDKVTSGKSVEEKKGKFIQWPINMKVYESDNFKTPVTILSELQAYESLLKKILKIYLTEDKIENYLGSKDEKAHMFNGQGITKDNIKTKLSDVDSVISIHSNIGNNFIKACKDNNIFDSKETFKIKLHRQNKKSHFARLPYPSVKDKWIEPMVIAKTNSKVFWTDYDIEKGWNNAEPLAADNVALEEGVNATNLFGGNKKEEETEEPSNIN